MSTFIEALQEAVQIVGGQSELARRIGGKVRQQHVHYWLKRGYIPPDHVIAIEAATEGRVSRHRLRPDIYPERGEVAAVG